MALFSILGARSLETPVFAHWHKLVPEFSTSPQEFYTALDAALRKRGVPQTVTSRIEYLESGLFSGLRIYFRIQRKRLAFDVCAAPFGTAFFFSWWLTEPKKSYRAWGCLSTLVLLYLCSFVLGNFGLKGCFFALMFALGAIAILIWSVREDWFLSEDIIRDLPYLGPLYEYLFDPETYFKEDTRIMYREIVHGAVLEVIDETLGAKGLRALAPEDRTPTVRSLLR
jgi:hypothetical protein